MKGKNFNLVHLKSFSFTDAQSGLQKPVFVKLGRKYTFKSLLCTRKYVNPMLSASGLCENIQVASLGDNTINNTPATLRGCCKFCSPHEPRETAESEYSTNICPPISL